MNWLIRLLKETNGKRVFVRIVWPSRAQDTICNLTDLRDDPGAIVGKASLPPRSFEVFLLSDDGRRFAGRKTFIEELEHIVPEFYDQIGQYLERWLPRPPKPVKADESGQPPKADKVVDTEQPAVSPLPNDRSGPRLGNLHTALVEMPAFLRRNAD